MKYEKPEISQSVSLEGELGEMNTTIRGSFMDVIPAT